MGEKEGEAYKGDGGILLNRSVPGTGQILRIRIQRRRLHKRI